MKHLTQTILSTSSFLAETTWAGNWLEKDQPDTPHLTSWFRAFWKNMRPKRLFFFCDTLLSEENKKEYSKDPYVKQTKLSCFYCDTIAAGSWQLHFLFYFYFRKHKLSVSCSSVVFKLFLLAKPFILRHSRWYNKHEEGWGPISIFSHSSGLPGASEEPESAQNTPNWVSRVLSNSKTLWAMSQET